MRSVVLSTAVSAAGFVVISFASAISAERPWLSITMVPIAFAIGWGISALVGGISGLWDRQVEDARARPAAEVEATARTVLVVAGGVILTVAVVVALVVLLADATAASNALATVAGMQTFGAQRYARWERESGRRLLAETRWRVGVRRPLVAVPASAVTPATGGG